jgi:hypothetical protein
MPMRRSKKHQVDVEPLLPPRWGDVLVPDSEVLSRRFSAVESALDRAPKLAQRAKMPPAVSTFVAGVGIPFAKTGDSETATAVRRLTEPMATIGVAFAELDTRVGCAPPGETDRAVLCALLFGAYFLVTSPQSTEDPVGSAGMRMMQAHAMRAAHFLARTPEANPVDLLPDPERQVSPEDWEKAKIFAHLMWAGASPQQESQA